MHCNPTFTRIYLKVEPSPNKGPESKAQSAHFSFKGPFTQTSKLFFQSTYSTLNTGTVPQEKPRVKCLAQGHEGNG